MGKGTIHSGEGARVDQRSADADAALSVAAELDPDEPLVWCARARIAFARGDIVTARDAGDRAIELGAPRPAVEASARGAYWLYLFRG